MEINIKLHVDEVNGILGILGNEPYAKIAPLVEKIRVQAQGQINAAEAPPETDEE